MMTGIFDHHDQAPVLDFEIGARIPPYCEEEPSDPLEEFLSVELAMSRYSHFENRKFVITIDNEIVQVGTRQASLRFEPDLSWQFFQLVEGLQDLQHRQPMILTFAEEWWLWKCTYQSPDFACVIFETFGRSLASTKFTCSHQQICDSFRSFLATVVQMAYETGYFDERQLAEVRGVLS